jgi:hypothetical protein
MLVTGLEYLGTVTKALVAVTPAGQSSLSQVHRHAKQRIRGPCS